MNECSCAQCHLFHGQLQSSIYSSDRVNGGGTGAIPRAHRKTQIIRMFYNLPKVDNVFYVQLLSWFLNNRKEGARIYGQNFLKFWVKAVVVKVSDGGALVSLPSLLELHDKKASYFYKRSHWRSFWWSYGLLCRFFYCLKTRAQVLQPAYTEQSSEFPWFNHFKEKAVHDSAAKPRVAHTIILAKRAFDVIFSWSRARSSIWFGVFSERAWRSHCGGAWLQRGHTTSGSCSTR